MIYFLGYVQRIKGPIVIDNDITNYLLRQAYLFGISQFPYIVGCIFAERKIYSKINIIFNKLRFNNLIAISLIILMIIAHGFVQTLFVAVFTGIAFIVLFNLIDKPNWLNNILYFLSKHSTNMWLTHMFFYMIFFKKLVFAPKYPVLIFIWLIILCVITSYLINIIYMPIVRLIEDRFNLNKKTIY